ncbi:hypothetical protein SAMN05443270_1071 [Lacrimispora sphenoides]|uniref:hypothetical protein n=1 Tax=Lacrimispora sphenoides TaxID=29370 RepID=UPI0008C55B11|nr:hypothetical protein [Lacrimispora sphenoides]SET71139.1 hypothetical protein SAMN05443270_1071 [Lacrimispora sphenoides]
MAYTDYTFYKEKYYGTAIAQEDFDRLAEKASDKLDTMTFDRLVPGLPADERAAMKVQKTVCAVADKLQEIEQAEKVAQAGGYRTDEFGNVVGNIVTSKTAGAESISFSATSSVKSAVISAAGDTQAQNRLCYETAKEYLIGVTDDCGVLLLYAGL